MSDDKVTIGLTNQGKQLIDVLVREKKWFAEGIDAAKFALALAVRAGAEPDAVEGVGTVWNVGSFDPGGELRDLIQALLPDTNTPYRVVENYVNIGFNMIADYLDRYPYANLSQLASLDEVAYE